MKTETLRKLAEMLGYEAHINIAGKEIVTAEGLWIKQTDFNSTVWFNPETDASQLLEVIDWMPFDQPFNKIGDGIWKAEGIWKVQCTYDGHVAESKSLAEAVLVAVEKMIGGSDE